MATNITIDESVTNVSISGITESTPTYTTITLSNDQGPQGPTGSTGPANSLSIGTVTGGVSASATITGTAPTQTLNLVLPKGDTGDTGPTGPANSLSIGTVSEGAAAATITGTAPSQTLNLTVPKGNTGNAATIAVGTVTTGAAGSSATVTNSGTSSAATFDFSIPRGNTGATGQGYTARGVYASGTTYAAYDVVFYNGQSYRCKLASTGNNPLNTTYWELFAMGYGTPVAYNASDTYAPGDTVTRLGSTYYCIATVTGAAPPNATYWILIASKGDKGDTGDTGATGPMSTLVGKATLLSSPTKATNNNTPEAVFRSSGGTINYFAVDADTTYAFDGILQMSTKASGSAAAARLSLIYIESGTTSNLTEQSARLAFHTNHTASAYVGQGGGTAANTNYDGSITSTSGITYHIYFRGFIRTNASSAGRINLGATQSVAGTSAAPDFILGSYMNIYKLGTGSTAQVGTWS